MKELNLRERQEASLRILLKVHNFCVNNKIRYSLAYGTLLGAVRHHGFIPWDDDIDIMMPRPDYDLFCKLYHSIGTMVIVPGYQSYIPYARVVDLSSTYEDDHTYPWTNIPHGVWIDIFPIDGATDDKEYEIKRYEKAKKLRYKNSLYRISKCKLKLCYNIIHNIKILYRKIRYGWYNPNPVYLKLLSEIDYNQAEYAVSLSIADDYELCYLPKSYFENFITIEFENEILMAFSNYKELLTKVYGDYMKLPPPSLRVPGHRTSKFYIKYNTKEIQYND